MTKVLTILSSPMVLEDGTFRRRTISLDEAKSLAAEAGEVRNYCGHVTVKLLGLDPVEARKDCSGFETALVLKPNGRLEFGKEYSVEEILNIGVTPVLIEKIGE